MTCISCKHLGSCIEALDVGRDKIFEGYSCEEHEEAPAHVESARRRAVTELGVAAVDTFMIAEERTK